METVALVLGIASLIGTLVGAWSNDKNNEFIDETNQENRGFQEQTNLQNHQWSLEAAEWEYQHNKPQKQYSDLLSAGLTPAAAAQKISGANVSYSPATAVAPQNMPKSTNIFSDSLQQVVSEIGNYSSMAQAQAGAEKMQAETKVISETAVRRANAEIDRILADTLKSYSDIYVNESQIDVNESQVDVNNANVNFIGEKTATEQVNRHSIELSNEEKKIQLEFTRKTLEMSVQLTEAQIKYLSEQTSKLKAELKSLDFENKFEEWRNVYIETYGVPPENGWEDMLFKSMLDGKAGPLLDSLSESLRQIFSPDNVGFNNKGRWSNWRDMYDDFDEKVGLKHFPTLKDWYNRDKEWYQKNGYR